MDPIIPSHPIPLFRHWATGVECLNLLCRARQAWITSVLASNDLPLSARNSSNNNNSNNNNSSSSSSSTSTRYEYVVAAFVLSVLVVRFPPFHWMGGPNLPLHCHPPGLVFVPRKGLSAAGSTASPV
ncbi:hypothetical protein LX36DRAFT_658079 [Colletotrichum falcatum]|nr:hypothetical protein LX36DRAFT_658079 [Colletotrichum falcatum]